MSALDWRAAYQRTHHDTAATLARLRREGRTFYRFGDDGPTCDPSRLGDVRLDELARLHAERVVNRAINQHNEQVERASVNSRRRAA